MVKRATSVLLLGNYRHTLTFIRSLSKAGYRVIIGRDNSRSYLEYSRHTVETWNHPVMEGTGTAFMDALAGFLYSRPDVSMVFPLADDTLDTVARHAYRIPASAKVVMADPSVVLACLDKAAMCNIISQIGIPQAHYFEASTLPELMAKADAIGYPCIIKPHDQLIRVFGQKAIICKFPEHLREAFTLWPDGNRSLIVQKFAYGVRHNIEFIAHEGECLLCVEIKTLRTDRPNGTGYTVDSIPVKPSPSIVCFTRRLVKHLNYSGLGCTQFMLDESQDSISFLELNPRISANFAITYYLGVDFPRMAADLFQGKSIGEMNFPKEYPTRRRMAWTYGDIDGLIHSVRNREVGKKEAFIWFWNMVKTFVKADVHVTWSLSDPLPTFVLYCRLFSRIFRMLVRFPFTILKRYSRDNFSLSGEKKSKPL